MPERKKIVCTKNVYPVILFLVTLSRNLLQAGIPIIHIELSQYDDLLLVNYANNILNGSWLGPYSETTLNKVPFFSIFLAVLNRLNIPYMSGVILFYTFACLLFLKAIRKFTGKWTALIFYIYILYSPIMFDNRIVQRVYRCSIIPPLVLIILSCALIIYSQRNNTIKKLAFWCTIEGIAFSMFNLTREDSLWFYSFVLGAIFLTMIRLAQEHKKSIPAKIYVKKGLIFLLPVFLCILSTNALRAVNYIKYGVYTTTDFNSTGYAAMGKSILRIASEDQTEHVWVTRSTIEKLYQVSPSFATLQPQLDSYYEEMDGWGTGAMDGEIEKDYIMWAIRWAAADSGLYSNAKETDAFFTKVNEEINEAFQNGSLEKNDAIILSNLGRPLYLNEVDEVLDSAVDNLWKNITYAEKECTLPDAVEYTENVDLVESISGNSVIKKFSDQYWFTGWIFSEDDEVSLTMEIKSGDDVLYEISFEESPDVYESYKKYGDFQNAKNCRFVLKSDEDLSDCTVEIRADNQLIFSGNASEIPELLNQNIHVNIEKNGYRETYLAQRAASNTAAANAIIKIYQITGAAAGLLAILLYLAELSENLVRLVKRRQTRFIEWLIKTGFLLTLAINYLVVSINYFDAFDRGGAIHLYTAGTYPLWQGFVCLTIAYAASLIRKKRR